LILIYCGKGRQDSPEVYKTIVSGYFKSAFENDIQALSEQLHPDLIFLGPKLGDTLNNDGLIASWIRFHRTFGRLEIQNVESYFIEDENTCQSVSFYYLAHFHHREKRTWIKFPVQTRFWFLDAEIRKILIIVNQADISAQLE